MFNTISSGKSDAHIVQLDRSNYNAPNLIKILKNEKITKIFHYARADLAFIKFYLKIDTKNILDTKLPLNYLDLTLIITR